MDGSTIEKGNAFRDLVASILAAANFEPTTETRNDFKKTDCMWVVPEFDGPVRFIGEAKDHGKALTMAYCSEFVAQYGTLVEAKKADRAWLISNGPISPDGRALVDLKTNLRAMTFEEFQRKILRVDDYLTELRDRSADEKLESWYVPPHAEDGQALDTIVENWLAADQVQQLAIMGGYGKGKSTFAQAMCSRLAKAALSDPTRRVPILIPLGEISDENSLEGLIGKHLATKAKVHGYSFSLFAKLNETGRFVIFLDGFDEMKHGMTFTKFEAMFCELLRLDVGKAKIVVLGRDTALHTDLEFRAIIEGRQTTASGLTVKSPDRRAFTPVRIKDFSAHEAREFVSRYLPIVIAKDRVQRSSAWISTRISEINSGKFDEIIVRPVHAKMLCEIATDDTFKLDELTRFGLYARFVHVLLLREVQKRGRDSVFDLSVRQRFNASLAYWLWQRGGAKSIDLESVPMQICKRVTKDVSHHYEDKKLRRELVAGCLIDKGSDTFYFSHRSLQEFLVADELIEMTRNRSLAARQTLIDAFSLVNAEIADFLVSGVKESSDIQNLLSQWVQFLSQVSTTRVTPDAFEAVFRTIDWDSHAVHSSSPWMDWLVFYRDNGSTDTRVVSAKAIDTLAERLNSSRARGKDIDVQAAILFLVAGLLPRHSEEIDLSPVLSAWLSPKTIAGWVDIYDSDSTTLNAVPKEKSFLSWSMLSFTRPVSVERRQYLEVDVRALSEYTEKLKKIGLSSDDLQTHGPEKLRLPLATYLTYVDQQEGGLIAEKVKRFLDSDKIRKRFVPTENRQAGRRAKP